MGVVKKVLWTLVEADLCAGTDDVEDTELHLEEHLDRSALDLDWLFATGEV